MSDIRFFEDIAIILTYVKMDQKITFVPWKVSKKAADNTGATGLLAMIFLCLYV